MSFFLPCHVTHLPTPGMYYSYALSGPMAMPFPHWEEDTPENHARLQKLQHFIRHSSQRPMRCKDDVLQYYEEFLALSRTMILTRFLTDDERDTAFWCGFHPSDCMKLLPDQPSFAPDFVEVFRKARTVFSYEAHPIPAPPSCPSPSPSPPLTSIAVPIPLHPAALNPSPENPPEIRLHAPDMSTFQ